MTVLSLAQNCSMWDYRSSCSFYQFINENNIPGEKKIQCFNGERGGEIHQDNFKSVIMTFIHCYGITSVQRKHEINRPKGFLI